MHSLQDAIDDSQNIVATVLVKQTDHQQDQHPLNFEVENH